MRIKLAANGIAGAGAFVIVMALAIGDNSAGPVGEHFGFVSSAEARVGRPATPISVAGVARRTTRRTVAVATTAVVVGRYYPALPAGCITDIRGSVTYYHCGSYWYQPVYSGSSVQYVVITTP